MLTVLLETFYLGRINKLQLVFRDGFEYTAGPEWYDLLVRNYRILADSIQFIFNSEKSIIHWIRHWIRS